MVTFYSSAGNNTRDLAQHSVSSLNMLSKSFCINKHKAAEPCFSPVSGENSHFSHRTKKPKLPWKPWHSTVLYFDFFLYFDDGWSISIGYFFTDFFSLFCATPFSSDGYLYPTIFSLFSMCL